ncbi:uncharacterized protein MONOS_6679 [Monocercomonoides exilis]|uniref:uncharacterized protein n=1 Tax=Monocercomonoides exilis TaxID=2049356 RepID=UPI003559A26C|nr:hypothetical protein MONOS_6679 [Monocercomonoides exilis]|eukprot:MONOS_6679.1-p1 / transcript=MONOS_6679.1 / gene=MONOS_6679 / organism=Monocercomonoides_exilis_PA203 / gene_product=unspecified product / transcript_product=unspecified product / location=Mono_scaffold00215:1186-1803(+) / protein_length=206 / sequence_SO=supercontig / SO=protein_coding / is_pseudo=false
MSRKLALSERHRIIELSSLIPAYDSFFFPHAKYKSSVTGRSGNRASSDDRSDEVPDPPSPFLPQKLFFRGFFHVEANDTVRTFKKRVLRSLLDTPACRRWWRRHTFSPITLFHSAAPELGAFPHSMFGKKEEWGILDEDDQRDADEEEREEGSQSMDVERRKERASLTDGRASASRDIEMFRQGLRSKKEENEEVKKEEKEEGEK